MTPLENKISKVKSLLEDNGLVIWDDPSKTQISFAHPPIDNWTMRIGDPKTNNDLSIDSGLARIMHHA